MMRRKKLMAIMSFSISLAIMIPGIGIGYDLPADRKITWKAGIPGGIPNRTTIFANVKESPYLAKGDGTTDDRAAIQDAINDCPVGQVVLLPAGTYRINGELAITKGIVLRGEGPESTRIRLFGSSTNIIRIGSSYSGSSTSVSSGMQKGSTSLTVTNSSIFKANDLLLIDQLNDPALVAKGDCTWCSRDSGNRAMGQIVEVKSINGNSISIDPALYYSFSGSLSPQAVKVSNNVTKYAGVEDLFVERVNPGGQRNFFIQYSAYSWLRNVESYNANEDHVRLRTSFRNEIRDSYFHDGHNFSGGMAYGVNVFRESSDNLIENNIFYYLRHSMVTQGGGMGNVFGYNFSDRMFDPNYPNTNWLMHDIVSHGAHPYMNLWEGNLASCIGPDFTHGSASHDTFFRNWIDMESEGEGRAINSHLVAVDNHAWNTYMNYVGNVFGTPGMTGSYEAEGTTCSNSTPYIYKLGYTSSSDCSPSGNDPLVKNSLIRHGNYDYISQNVQWDPIISDHNLLPSFYLATKPTFFGNKSWPVFGPDVNPMTGVLPAKERFDMIQSGEAPDDISPAPPTQLEDQGSTP